MNYAVLFSLIVFGISACISSPTQQNTVKEESVFSKKKNEVTGTSELTMKVWLPNTTPEIVVLALHGFNDYSNFINNTALVFTKQSIAVYAYDQRGFGASPNPGIWPGSRVLIDDLTTMIELVQARHPDTPFFILAESMGGAVTLLTLTNYPLHLDGVVLLAPAVWSRNHMPWYQRAGLWITYKLVPGLKVTGETLEVIPSDNKQMLKDLGRDPLVIKKSRIDTLKGLTDLMDAAFCAAQKFKTKALVLYGENDEIIPMEPVLEMFQKFPEPVPNKQRFILYKNGYHMLLRDLQAERVRNDIIAWIKNESSKTPSVLENQSREIFKNQPD